MKKIAKSAVCAMALVANLGVGMITEAGSIPTNKVPLHTYAVRKVTCYLTPGGTAKGWIDPGDYVIVTQIRGDGWAYGSYPVKNGRTSRWFKANDLIFDVNLFANMDRYSPQNKVYVYKDANRTTGVGSVWGNEAITLISGYGKSIQIIYKINGGYKMGWIHSDNCLTYEQAFKKPIPVPIGGDTINPALRWDSQIGKQLANTNSAAYNSQNPFAPRYVGQCTWYAWGRMKEVTGKSITFRVSSGRHAKNWPNVVNNCSVDNNLTSKCVAVRFTGGGGYGHVVFVEYVNGDNVYYSEDNVNSATNRKIRKTTVSNFKNSYTKFIH